MKDLQQKGFLYPKPTPNVEFFVSEGSIAFDGRGYLLYIAV